MVGVTSNDKNITEELYHDMDSGSFRLKNKYTFCRELAQASPQLLSKPKTSKLIIRVAII